jgi:chromosome segregation ATPase
MPSNDELDARVTALEREVRLIREDAAAARVLAGGADRDVSAMQATLREHTTKLDGHTATLDQHTATLDRHTTTLDRHTTTLDRHTTTLDQHTTTLDQHTATLDSHGAKLDVHKTLLESLRETQVEQGQRMDSMEAEMRRGFSMLAVGQAEILALLNRPDDAEPAG